MLGPNLAAARMFIAISGRIKFSHDQRWLTSIREGFVRGGKNEPVVHGIDLSETSLMLPAMEYLCKKFQAICIFNIKHVANFVL